MLARGSEVPKKVACFLFSSYLVQTNSITTLTHNGASSGRLRLAAAPAYGGVCEHMAALSPTCYENSREVDFPRIPLPAIAIGLPENYTTKPALTEPNFHMICQQSGVLTKETRWQDCAIQEGKVQ